MEELVPMSQMDNPFLIELLKNSTILKKSKIKKTKTKRVENSLKNILLTVIPIEM